MLPKQQENEKVPCQTEKSIHTVQNPGLEPLSLPLCKLATSVKHERWEDFTCSEDSMLQEEKEEDTRAELHLTQSEDHCSLTDGPTEPLKLLGTPENFSQHSWAEECVELPPLPVQKSTTTNRKIPGNPIQIPPKKGDQKKPPQKAQGQRAKKAEKRKQHVQQTKNKMTLNQRQTQRDNQMTGPPKKQLVAALDWLTSHLNVAPCMEGLAQGVNPCKSCPIYRTKLREILQIVVASSPALARGLSQLHSGKVTLSQLQQGQGSSTQVNAKPVGDGSKKVTGSNRQQHRADKPKGPNEESKSEATSKDASRKKENEKATAMQIEQQKPKPIHFLLLPGVWYQKEDKLKVMMSFVKKSLDLGLLFEHHKIKLLKARKKVEAIFEFAEPVLLEKLLGDYAQEQNIRTTQLGAALAKMFAEQKDKAEKDKPQMKGQGQVSGPKKKGRKGNMASLPG